MANPLLYVVPNANGHAYIHCPGCNDIHAVNVGPNGWGYNGNPESPTLTPSVHSKSGHFARANGDATPGNCYCDVKERIPDWDDDHKCVSCHSYVRAGKIEFLSDCSHDKAGQTLELLPVPDWVMQD